MSTVMKSNLKILLIIGLLLAVIIGNTPAQVNLIDLDIHETRTFAKNPIYEIQSIYLDNEGNSSYEVFLRKNNLYPQNPTTEVKPFFTVSFLENDLREKNGRPIPKNGRQGRQGYSERVGKDRYSESKGEYHSE